jgi:malonyl CoA-acyl carrier protein transacylase
MPEKTSKDLLKSALVELEHIVSELDLEELKPLIESCNESTPNLIEPALVNSPMLLHPQDDL